MNVEISLLQYHDATMRYYNLVAKLPIHLMEVCPGFDEYLTPSGFTMIQYNASRDYVWIKLSDKAVHRFHNLFSPHAATLLRVWAIQRKEHHESLQRG